MNTIYHAVYFGLPFHSEGQ